jgi:hypothetical protein
MQEISDIWSFSHDPTSRFSNFYTAIRECGTPPYEPYNK